MTVQSMENGRIITETERLIIREMVPSDFNALCRILCDEEVMCMAYENAFSIEEAQNWMNRHFRRYEEYAFSVLNVSSAYSMIRDKHTTSQKVAVQNGMKVVDMSIKNFRNVNMNFLLYCAEKINEDYKN